MSPLHELSNICPSLGVETDCRVLHVVCYPLSAIRYPPTPYGLLAGTVGCPHAWASSDCPQALRQLVRSEVSSEGASRGNIGCALLLIRKHSGGLLPTPGVYMYDSREPRIYAGTRDSPSIENNRTHITELIPIRYRKREPTVLRVIADEVYISSPAHWLRLSSGSTPTQPSRQLSCTGNFTRAHSRCTPSSPASLCSPLRPQ